MQLLLQVQLKWSCCFCSWNSRLLQDIQHVQTHDSTDCGQAGSHRPERTHWSTPVGASSRSDVAGVVALAQVSTGLAAG
jgi:hypothetical protein